MCNCRYIKDVYHGPCVLGGQGTPILVKKGDVAEISYKKWCKKHKAIVKKRCERLIDILQKRYPES